MYDQIVITSITIPLYFSAPSTCSIEAPEKITITLSGKRCYLYDIDEKNLAAHIPLDDLFPGKHDILLKEQHLFLPPSITLVHYKPSMLSIIIKEK